MKKMKQPRLSTLLIRILTKKSRLLTLANAMKQKFLNGSKRKQYYVLKRYLIKIKNYNMYDNASILKILFDDLYRNNQLLEKYNVIIKNNELHDKLVKEKEANALIINELEEVKNKIKFCNLQDMLTSIKKKETLVDTIKKLNNIKEIENQLKNYKNETETEDTLNDLDDYLK